MSAALLRIRLYEYTPQRLLVLLKDGTLEHVWRAEAYLSLVEGIHAGVV